MGDSEKELFGIMKDLTREEFEAAYPGPYVRAVREWQEQVNRETSIQIETIEARMDLEQLTRREKQKDGRIDAVLR